MAVRVGLCRCNRVETDESSTLATRMSKAPFQSGPQDELRALLGDLLRTKHLARPLVAVDWVSADPSEASRRHEARLSVLGVMDRGKVVGAIRGDALQEADWRSRVDPISDEQIIDGDASLLDLIKRLQARHWLFVRHGDDVNGFVSRSDLQRPPFRMLLFGLISLFEMGLLHLLEESYTEAQITETLTANRLEKARSLHSERMRRGEELHLADCLQIADKRDLLLADSQCLGRLGFESVNKAYRFFGRVEDLRDRLVHANDLIAGSSWEEVLQVTLELAEFLRHLG